MSKDTGSRRGRRSVRESLRRAVEANRPWLNPGVLAVCNVLLIAMFIAMLPISRLWPPFELFIVLVLFLTVLIVLMSLVVNLAYLPINSRYLGRIILLYLSQ